MKTIYFVDLDGTVIPHGDCRGIIPHSKARLDEIGANPDNHVWFYSCWAFTPQNMQFLQQTFPYAKGFIEKPLADKYVFIDDKHDVEISAAEAARFFPKK